MSKRTMATMYGVGLTGVIPGTFGSAAAMLLAWPLLLLPFGWALVAVGVVVITILGSKSATRYMASQATKHDPGEIVVDEWAGQWLTYSVWHLWLIGMAGNREAAFALLHEVAASPVYLVLGFFVFRFFDILKPWPISWADRKIKTGFGVVFDDLLAAIPAGTVLYLLYLFSPLVFGPLESTV